MRRRSAHWEGLGDAGVDVLLGVMSHPNLAEGITDDDAKIVALLGGTYKYQPGIGGFFAAREPGCI